MRARSGASRHRTLQTFIHSKVNRPIVFFYDAVEVDGKSIGVIEIPVQDRPFFLTKKYGRLEAQVFLRRSQEAQELDGAIRVQTRCFEVPDEREIPGYGTNNALGISLRDENEDFYADIALYLSDVVHLEPLAVFVTNESRTTAQQVVVRIRFVEPELEVLSPRERQKRTKISEFTALGL